MKIKRLYLLGIGLMFTSQFLTSCHDLLEKDPTDSYSETVAWSSESSLDMYVTYLYKPPQWLIQLFFFILNRWIYRFS